MIAELRQSKNKKLVGPSVASDKSGRQWLRDFMRLLGQDEYPNFLGVHYYGTEAADAKAYIESMREFRAQHSLKCFSSQS